MGRRLQRHCCWREEGQAGTVLETEEVNQSEVGSRKSEVGLSQAYALVNTEKKRKGK